MKRDWKPGDVASTLGVGSQPAFRTPKGWTYIDGSTGDANGDNYGFRPLVVIDPDDREQVERLVSLQTAAEVGNGMSFADALQAALREFADPKPPRPSEPTGLGAVIEDDKGDRWVRVGGNLDGIPRPWAEHGNIADLRDWVRYADITAVAVLSEGVRDD